LSRSIVLQVLVLVLVFVTKILAKITACMHCVYRCYHHCARLWRRPTGKSSKLWLSWYSTAGLLWRRLLLGFNYSRSTVVLPW